MTSVTYVSITSCWYGYLNVSNIKYKWLPLLKWHLHQGIFSWQKKCFTVWKVNLKKAKIFPLTLEILLHSEKSLKTKIAAFFRNHYFSRHLQTGMQLGLLKHDWTMRSASQFTAIVYLFLYSIVSLVFPTIFLNISFTRRSPGENHNHMLLEYCPTYNKCGCHHKWDLNTWWLNLR